MSLLIEVCCDNINSVINIEESLAERIEICSGLQVGGLTPSYGLVAATLEKSSKKINVLIRPRPGNFIYSDEEFDIMCRDILYFKTLGVNSIVAGILDSSSNVDIVRTNQLIKLARPLLFTFHRAFDFCNNLGKAASDIINCGADRILSSGGKSCVDEGLDNLMNLHKEFGDKIVIMPGGGLNKYNIQSLAKGGIEEFHLSGSSFKADSSVNSNNLATGFGYYIYDGLYGYNYSDKNKINDLFENVF